MAVGEPDRKLVLCADGTCNAFGHSHSNVGFSRGAFGIVIRVNRCGDASAEAGKCANRLRNSENERAGRRLGPPEPAPDPQSARQQDQPTRSTLSSHLGTGGGTT